MKKIVILFFVIIAFLSCSKENDFVGNENIDKDVTLVDNSGPRLKSPESDWNSLTQTQKDDKIMNRAYLDDGTYVGVECKDWVKRVVNSASGGWVTVPSTKANPYNYLWNPIRNIVKRELLIRNVDRCDMIQMRFIVNGGPHTAIVVSKTSTSMVWIHSNWHNDCRVTKETITFDYFDRTFGSQYGIYRAY